MSNVKVKCVPKPVPDGLMLTVTPTHSECPDIVFATEGMMWTVASMPSTYESMSYAEEPVWQRGRIVVAELAEATCE